MATQPRVSGRLRFDGFELDLRAGELRRQGVRLRLRGQPLLVLEILLERAGDVVTREELQGRIWPADTFVDFDHSLHNAIARIREVLGDSAEKPRYIETLPRRGYRYIGSLEEIQSPELAAENGEHRRQAPHAVINPEQKSGLVPVRGALFMIVILALGLAALTTWRYMSAKAASPPMRSIAVLPFSNLSGNPSEEYFADGMTDQLITDLAKIGSLRVISRTSVMQYKGAKKSLPEIARELNADAIVEGSVIRSGQRVRVTAQLLQGSADRHLWAETYDRDPVDILKLQSEVADAIAQQVRAEITPAQKAQIHRAGAVDPGAYDSYIKGRIYFTTEYTKPESLRKAQHLFQDAIAKDQNFGLAYAGLADTYVYLAFAGALPREEASRSARKALARALELDDTIGEAYDTLGVLSWQFDWDWEAADRAFNRAIELSPSYSCALEDRALFLAFRGRRAEALAEIAKIDQLDAGFSAAESETAAYSQLRDYPRLIQASQRGLLLDPNSSSQHYNLGVGYEETGRLQEAVAEYRKAMAAPEDTERATVALAHAWVAQGKKAEAENMLRELEHNQKAAASPYTMATIYAGLGERDEALSSLEKACSEKSFDVESLTSDLLLDSLRSDPRFQILLLQFGLTQNRTHG
ncbi:MAG TPA: winged helix-turn-helix domain-containing protein [Acidobacteriaceae bacterium]|jgi:TolB-like protein/DNA-binding winged helix-turn-helix (wHTH) protein/Tfp pilus assembly protein PilF|nr:winged helix-turn-helix domain-containing protein [Acidobacteriaceae bacterium]